MIMSDMLVAGSAPFVDTLPIELPKVAAFVHQILLLKKQQPVRISKLHYPTTFSNLFDLYFKDIEQLS